jgi:hypothetical protein
LLEPPLQTVYHVVFANHTSKQYDALFARNPPWRGGVKDQSGRKALDLFVAGFRFSSPAGRNVHRAG